MVTARHRKTIKLVGKRLGIGEMAPEFECVTGLEVRTLSSTPPKTRIFSVVASVDMSVCAEQIKRFDSAIANFADNVAGYTVSLDLPFAQGRFAKSADIDHMTNLSDVRNMSFGRNYGVLIENLPFPLLSRAVFVVNRHGRITYAEYVAELTNAPNYDAALAAIKAALHANSDLS